MNAIEAFLAKIRPVCDQARGVVDTVVPIATRIAGIIEGIPMIGAVVTADLALALTGITMLKTLVDTLDAGLDELAAAPVTTTTTTTETAVVTQAVVAAAAPDPIATPVAK